MLHLKNSTLKKEVISLKAKRKVFIHDTYTGEVEYRHGGFKFFGEQELFNSGWTAGMYVFFAEHYGD